VVAVGRLVGIIIADDLLDALVRRLASRSSRTPA
jgi:CBS domain-containing protein